MGFVILHDETYGKLRQILKESVPSFNSVFNVDDTNEMYLVLGEFTRFLRENITDDLVAEQCFQFINTVLEKGGNKTKDTIGLQVFEPIYDDAILSKKVELNLNQKAKGIFIKYKPV